MKKENESNKHRGGENEGLFGGKLKQSTMISMDENAIVSSISF